MSELPPRNWRPEEDEILVGGGVDRHYRLPQGVLFPTAVATCAFLVGATAMWAVNHIDRDSGSRPLSEPELTPERVDLTEILLSPADLSTPRASFSVVPAPEREISSPTPLDSNPCVALGAMLHEDGAGEAQVQTTLRDENGYEVTQRLVWYRSEVAATERMNAVRRYVQSCGEYTVSSGSKLQRVLNISSPVEYLGYDSILVGEALVDDSAARTQIGIVTAAGSLFQSIIIQPEAPPLAIATGQDETGEGILLEVAARAGTAKIDRLKTLSD